MQDMDFLDLDVGKYVENEWNEWIVELRTLDSSIFFHLEFVGMSQITFEQLVSVFHLPLLKAAERLGVGVTALKRACRRNFVLEWPYREIKRCDRLISQLNYEMAVCKDQSIIDGHRDSLRAILVHLESLMSAEFYKGTADISNGNPASVVTLTDVSNGEPFKRPQSFPLPCVNDVSCTLIPPREPGNSPAASFTVRSRTRCIDLLNYIVDSQICTDSGSYRPMMMFVRELAMFACPGTSCCKQVAPTLSVENLTLPALPFELHLNSPKLCCLEPIDVAPFPMI